MPGLTARLSPVSRSSFVTTGVLALVIAAGTGLRWTGAAGPADALRIPNRASANVSLAADQSFLVAVWAGSVAGGATDVFAAVSRDAGTTFTDPVRVKADTTMPASDLAPGRVDLTQPSR